MTVELLEAATAAATRGEVVAFRTIYDALAPRVCGYFTVRGAEDPEGLTNDVFVKVVPRLTDLTGGWDGLRAFVFSVAHARMVDDYRSRGRRPVHQQYDPADDRRMQPSAEDQALDRVASRQLLDVLDLLPDDQRDVVIMRVLADLSIAQTAVAIDRSEPAVKKLQSKALASLRNLLTAGEGRLMPDPEHTGDSNG